MINFIFNALVKQQHVGAVMTSSRALADMLTDTLLINRAKSIVELGPGTGAVTQVIEKKKRESAKLIGIEIIPSFANMVKERCPKAIIYNDNAINLEKYLKKHNIGKCDLIISTMPFSYFGNELQLKMLEVIYDNLNKDGEFISIVHVTSAFLLPSGYMFRNKLKKYFRKIRISKPVFSYFPPSIVYYCSK